MTSPIEAAILALLADRASGRSICPSEAARRIDPGDWRRLMPQIRTSAVALARAGRLEITRHGEAADPEAFKGVYRLRGPVHEGPAREDPA